MATNMITIYNKKIGLGEPCYIISEIGNNHGGDVDLAKEMIRVSADCGCDAVKFQTFRGTDIVNPLVKSDEYPEWDVSGKYPLWYQFLDSFALPYESYPDLIEYAHGLGIAFISTPTSIKTANFLDSNGADAIKIASMDLTNKPLIERINEFGRPVILSTGMGTIEEIKEVVSWLNDVPLALLHCVSNYPLETEHANLLNIRGLKKVFNLPIGFSDHSLGIILDIAAVALGAVIIEKHFTLDRNSLPKIEHHFSLEPNEFKELVKAAQEIKASLGSIQRKVGKQEKENSLRMRRSLMLNRDKDAGETILEDALIWLRPGTGIPPKNYREIIGKRLRRHKKAFEPLNPEDMIDE
jgi:sialic acid synthase SpsE